MKATVTIKKVHNGYILESDNDITMIAYTQEDVCNCLAKCLATTAVTSEYKKIQFIIECNDLEK